MRSQTTLAIASLLLLGGCVVGPNYKRPLVSVPQEWTVAAARGTSKNEPQTDAWWTSFRDTELDSLVTRAIGQNLDLKLALERVAESRAARGVARSAEFPSLDSGVSATRLRGGFNEGVIRAVPSSPASGARSSLLSPFETSVYEADLSASWELDVFGGIRRGVQAATADVAAAEEDRRDVLVVLLGDIGQAYTQLRGFQQRLEIANQNIQTQQDTMDLTSARAKAGLATEFDVSRAAAQLESTKAVVPSLVSGIDSAVHRLGVLLGEEPGALREELVQTAPIPTGGPEVEVGLPTDLLERRPDIRRAEAQIAGATARVGQAKADYFPRFVLTGSAGRQATQLHDLTLGLGNFFSAGPGISLPVFTAGRIRSNVAVQSSREREAAITYRSTILKALEEVENALVSYSQAQERRDRLTESVKQSQLAVELANDQYRAGLADFLSVLDAQREVYANEDQLVQSQAAVTSDLIALYRALGGGWSAGGSVSMNKPAAP